MTRISKQKLGAAVQKKLFMQMVEMFTSAEKGRQSELFTALFSESEQIMFVKRVAMVFLISKEYSTYAISKMLKVSDSTVRSIQKQAKTGKFDPMIGAIKKRSFNKNKFLDTLEVLLSGGLSPRGKGRWDRVNALLGKE